MGGVDLEDQMVQPYLLETKQAKKWYVKFFKRLVNVAVHNAFIVYNSRNKMHYLTYCLELIKALTRRPQVVLDLKNCQKNPPPETLFGRYFIEKIPATGKKAKPGTRCAVWSL
jgi:hypothetical protein